jgi:sec-independent protein translocase protein TatA
MGQAKKGFMGTLSIWHILILMVAMLLLFGGGGKISDLMGDVAKGIKAFRAGVNDTEPDRPQPCATTSGPFEPTLETTAQGIAEKCRISAAQR